MPLVKKIGAYEFRFGSRGEQNEPPHIHVWRGGAKAKFWLRPVVDLATYQRFKRHELNEIERLVYEYQQEFLEAWDEHFR
jgi:hypothetical protein